MDPFQDGFMAAVWDGAGGQAATIATEGAAMHLMGQWAPGTQNANSPDGEGLGDKLGWFPFPAVEGGAGDPTDAFGGGNGFAVGKDAPPEAVDFLQYATSLDVANRWGETNSGILPVTIGADASITDPNLTGVLEARAKATFVQLYLDQAYPPELGAVINDAVAELFAGQAVAGAGRARRSRMPPRRDGATASLERPAPARRPAAGADPRRDSRTARRGRPSAASARPGASGRTIVLFLLPAVALYVLFVLVPIGPGPLLQRLRLERPRAAHRLRRARQLPRGARRPGVPRLAPPRLRDPRRCRCVVQLPFALGLAVLLNQRIRGRAILRLLFFLPFVLSEVITAVVWRLLLQPDGLADSTLEFVGLGRFVQEWLADPEIVLYTLFVVITWKYFGFHMILYLAGLQQIPRELEEAAALDGATKWETFRHVTLPLLGPTIRISAFLSIIGSLQLFDLVWVMTGGGPVNASNTMAVYMIDQGFERSRFGYGSAVAVLVFLLCFVIALALPALRPPP